MQGRDNGTVPAVMVRKHVTILYTVANVDVGHERV